jgi:hypothetical protein
MMNKKKNMDINFNNYTLPSFPLSVLVLVYQFCCPMQFCLMVIFQLEGGGGEGEGESEKERERERERERGREQT